jgi:hypothetical protein
MRRLLRSGAASLILLLALFAILRLPALTADPPAALVSHYQDFAFSVFDEGWWTANAREAVLFGAMRGTGFDLIWVSPVFTLLMTAMFSVAGVSLASARLLSIVMGAIGVVLLWRAGRASADPRAARTSTLAALLWVVAFAPAQLGRLAVPETAGIALGLAGAASLLTRRAAGDVAAGAFAVLAMLVKPHFGFLVPTFLATSLVLSLRGSRPIWPGLARIVAGAAVPLLVWGVYVARHAQEAASLASFYLTDRWFAGVPPELGPLSWIKPAAQVAIAGVVYRHHYFTWLPGLFLLAVLATPRVAAAILRPRRAEAVPDAAVLFGLWALVGGSLISSLPFQPLRYYMPLVPALAYLAAFALTGGPAPAAAAASSPDTSPPASSRLAAVLRWAFGVFVLAQVLFVPLAAWLPARAASLTSTRVELLNPVDFHLASFLVRLVKARSVAPFADQPREIAIFAALALCGAVALGAAVLFGIVLARPLVRAFRSLEALVPRTHVAVLVLVLGFQAVAWAGRVSDAPRTIPAMARAIETIVPPDATVSPAGSYSLDSRRRYDSSAVSAGRMFDASGGADYFVALVSHPRIGVLPDGEIERRWPGSEPVEAFELTGDYVYRLYRAAPTARP